MQKLLSCRGDGGAGCSLCRQDPWRQGELSRLKRQALNFFWIGYIQCRVQSHASCFICQVHFTILHPPGKHREMSVLMILVQVSMCLKFISNNTIEFLGIQAVEIHGKSTYKNIHRQFNRFKIVSLNLALDVSTLGACSWVPWFKQNQILF